MSPGHVPLGNAVGALHVAQAGKAGLTDFTIDAVGLSLVRIACERATFNKTESQLHLSLGMARSSSPAGVDFPEQASAPIVGLAEHSQLNDTDGAAHAAIITEGGDTEPASKKRKHKHHKKHKHKHKKQKRSSAERQENPSAEVPEAFAAPSGRENALDTSLAPQIAAPYGRGAAAAVSPGAEHPLLPELARQGAARQQADLPRPSSAAGVKLTAPCKHVTARPSFPANTIPCVSGFV